MNKQFLHFNANNFVKVKLTETGKQILLQHYGPATLSASDAGDGWYKLQLHQLINVYGGKLNNSLLPFEMDMMVEIEIGE